MGRMTRAINPRNVQANLPPRSCVCQSVVSCLSCSSLMKVAAVVQQVPIDQMTLADQGYQNLFNPFWSLQV